MMISSLIATGTVSGLASAIAVETAPPSFGAALGAGIGGRHAGSAVVALVGAGLGALGAVGFGAFVMRSTGLSGPVDTPRLVAIAAARVTLEIAGGAIGARLGTPAA
jgi:hypothetical protein